MSPKNLAHSPIFSYSQFFLRWNRIHESSRPVIQPAVHSFSMERLAVHAWLTENNFQTTLQIKCELDSELFSTSNVHKRILVFLCFAETNKPQSIQSGTDHMGDNRWVPSTRWNPPIPLFHLHIKPSAYNVLGSVCFRFLFARMERQLVTQLFKI